MRAIDGISNKFAAEASTSQTALLGGYYELSAASGNWNGAHLLLDRLLPDGQTWLTATDLALTANGVALGYLSTGSYRLAVDTAVPTDPIFAALSRVPTGE
jgi:hypothetical protein